MTNHRLETRHPVLNEMGRVIEPGYATSLILEYSRQAIKAAPWRIKEWDYYWVGNDEWGLALTMADNSYMGLIGAVFFDFKAKTRIKYEKMLWGTFGKLHMPEDSNQGTISYVHPTISMMMSTTPTGKKLTVDIPKFNGDQALKASLNFDQLPRDSMVILTPYSDDKKAFYYNQKVNCMVAHGTITYGDRRIDVDGQLGVLDWGRGVWTYDNTWYWGSLSTTLPDGHRFGFNIGYGFGDTSAASENMLFYDGIAHKLDRLDFGIPIVDGKKNFMSPWNMSSSDGRFEVTFTPIFDNETHLNLIVLGQDAHQVFGYFDGTCLLDDGTVVTLDKAFGFAEQVRNRW